MPTLLESFYFAFEADVKSVEKGLKSGDDASKKLEESLQGLDKTASKIGLAFVDLAKKAGTAVAGIVALGAVKKLVLDTAEHTFQIRQQAQALAISTEALSAWQNTVVSAGGTAEGATQSLAGLQQKLIELSRFPGGMTPDGFMLKRLGLTAQDMHAGIQNPTAAMEKLADTFSGLNKVQQQFVGRRLGFDQGTITLLAEGRRALDEHIQRMKELGVVTQQQADVAAAFKMQTNELGIELETVAREVVSIVLPPLTWLLKKIEDTVLFLREHKGFTIAFFTGLGVVVADTVVPAFISAATAIWAFLAPILAGPALIAALVAILALLWDDAEHFLNGQNSLIGELAKKWPMLGQIIKSVLTGAIDVFKLLAVTGRDAIDYLVAIAKFLGNVIAEGPTKALKDLNSEVGDIFGDLKKHFSGAVDDAKKLGQGFSDIWHGKNPFKHDDQSDDAAQDAKTQKAVGKSETATGREIASKLEKLGWSPAQAAGIAGSVLQESSGNAHAVNPTSGAEGLGQWLGSRKADFEKWAGHPLSQSTLDEQIAFMNYELRSGKEQRAGKMLMAAQTPEQAAQIHGQYYERAGANEMNMARREQLANSIAAGQGQIQEANTNPVNTQNTSTVTSNNQVNTRGNTTVTVAGSTINTQATDGAQLAASYHQHLQTQLRNAQDQDDDGVAA